MFRLIAARDTGFAHVIMVAGSTLASPFNGIFASVPRFSNLTLPTGVLFAAQDGDLS